MKRPLCNLILKNIINSRKFLLILNYFVKISSMILSDYKMDIIHSTKIIVILFKNKFNFINYIF